MSEQSPWGAAPDTATSAVQTASDAVPAPLTDISVLSAANDTATTHFSLLHPFEQQHIPFGHGVDVIVAWIVTHFRGFFTAVKVPINWILSSVDGVFQAVPPLLMIVLLALLCWQLSGRKLALASVIGLAFIGLIGAWADAMTTLSLVVTAVFFSVLIGIPTGIWMARSETAAKIMRPLLDTMQTTPAFVYLVPIVMLFGIGNVPGVVVTIIFALAPVIRLTNLGIRQVPADLIEAGNSFGADKKQMLFKIQLPLAMPTIMAGVNQTLMLSLSMVVIASMISVGGLGLMVLRGIGRLDIGLAATGGIGIVILAILLDRMTQSLGKSNRSRGRKPWYRVGPVGLVYGLFKRESA